jgi:nitric oxide reductase subunit C
MKLRVGVVTVLLTTWVGSAWAVDVQEFYKKKCELCHSIAGVGGKRQEKGGPLDGVGSKRDEVWLRAYLAVPKSKIPDSKMPKIKMSPEQTDAIVAFLLECK